MRALAARVAASLALAAAPIRAQDPGAGAPDTLGLGLRDAILMALERNPTVSIQRLEPAIAGTYVREEGGAFEPRIAASVSTARTKSQRFLGSNPSPFELTSERQEYDVTLSSRLPTGTTVSAGATISGSLSSIYTDQYTGDVGLTVTQSLLQGLAPGDNLADLRRARVDADISELELKAVAEEVIAQVERAYWDLYLADQERAIQQQSLALAGTQLAESAERVAVGRLPELELAAVRAEVATRREAMIDAESRYEQARLTFLYLLNPPGESPWDMVPVPGDRPFAPASELDPVAVHEALALQYRADLGQARLDLRKGVLELARTRSGLLPRLDLFITLGRTT
ncbi:MAG: TolC family protein, partial [Gemmatimonadota bacterium]